MKSLKLNKDVLALKESATLAINLKAIAKGANGEQFYHWVFGQSPFPVPSKTKEELKLRIIHKEYLPTSGLPEWRKTLPECYTQVKKEL
jgi:aspartate aminotransferase